PPQPTPTYEYAGFTVYLLSLLSFVIYLIYAFTPPDYLHAIGISYYPNKYWAIALPSWSLIAVGMIVVVNVGLTLYRTKAFEDFETLTGLPI
ncbi:PIG-P, partial [Paraphysoderma sedebokerense]